MADTHTALWYLEKDPRLSRLAQAFIYECELSGNFIAVSSISLAEVVYLVEKGRVSASAYEELRAALIDSEHVFEEVPLSRSVTDAMRLVPRNEVPDMPDRIVAATSVMLGVPVISRDGKIRASGVTTIW